MGGFVIKVSGLQETIAKLDPAKYNQQIQQCFDNFGNRVRTTALELVPVDEGGLKKAIYAKSLPLAAEVGANIFYAAYIEFGTRSFAASYVSTLPATWQELAATFKGGSAPGGFEQLVKDITEWVLRKGFAAQLTSGGNASKSVSSITAQKQAAYLIARSILIKGIKPQPFLYPAFNEWYDQLIKDLKNIKLT